MHWRLIDTYLAKSQMIGSAHFLKDISFACVRISVFLATLVALHIIPVIESVSESVGIVLVKRSLELVLEHLC